MSDTNSVFLTKGVFKWEDGRVKFDIHDSMRVPKGTCCADEDVSYLLLNPLKQNV